MNLDPETLKAQALKYRLDNKVKNKKSEQPVNLYTEEELLHNVDQLEKHVQEFALQGHLAVDYKFKTMPVELRAAVAIAFKTRNPRLFVMEYGGENKITVTWDNRNHV